MEQENKRDDALFEALNRKKKKRKRKIIRTAVIIILVLAIALVAGILYLRHQVTVRFATSNVDAVSAETTLGSISTQVSGTGTLMNVDEESLVVPVGVIVEEILVSAHDSVAEGQLLAKTVTDSVLPLPSRSSKTTEEESGRKVMTE